MRRESKLVISFLFSCGLASGSCVPASAQTSGVPNPLPALPAPAGTKIVCASDHRASCSPHGCWENEGANTTPPITATIDLSAKTVSICGEWPNKDACRTYPWGRDSYETARQGRQGHFGIKLSGESDWGDSKIFSISVRDGDAYFPVNRFLFSHGTLNTNRTYRGICKWEVVQASATQPTTTAPAPQPSSTTTAPAPAPQPSATPAVAPYTPQAGPLTLLNCAGKSITAKTFNSNDGVMWVPFQSVPIAHGRYGGLKCATSTCKLMIDGTSIKTGALSGYQVYARGAIKGTNTAAMQAGCGIY